MRHVSECAHWEMVINTVVYFQGTPRGGAKQLGLISLGGADGDPLSGLPQSDQAPTQKHAQAEWGVLRQGRASGGKRREQVARAVTFQEETPSLPHSLECGSIEQGEMSREQAGLSTSCLCRGALEARTGWVGLW